MVVPGGPGIDAAARRAVHTELDAAGTPDHALDHLGLHRRAPAVLAGQMYEQGVKMRIFGAGVGTLGAVVVGKNSGITSIAELKRKKVGGIPGTAATHDMALE